MAAQKGPTYLLYPATVLTLMFTTAAHGNAKTDQALLDSGKKLIAESKCEACHVRKVGGDGSTIYTRADRRVTTKSKLLPQVERCSAELNLGLFPDDEAAIAAYLNATHYKFKD